MAGVVGFPSRSVRVQWGIIKLLAMKFRSAAWVWFWAFRLDPMVCRVKCRMRSRMVRLARSTSEVDIRRGLSIKGYLRVWGLSSGPNSLTS